MQKHIKHTALLLLLVIAYPFIFQSLHIIYHDHSRHTARHHAVNHGTLNHTSPLSGSCTHTPGDDPHHFPGDHNHDSSGERSGTGTDIRYFSSTVIPENKDHDHKECPLCDHEFAKFKLERSMNIFFLEEIFTIINTSFYQNPAVLYTGNHISPRAPPRRS